MFSSSVHDNSFLFFMIIFVSYVIELLLYFNVADAASIPFHILLHSFFYVRDFFFAIAIASVVGDTGWHFRHGNGSAWP